MTPHWEDLFPSLVSQASLLGIDHSGSLSTEGEDGTFVLRHPDFSPIKACLCSSRGRLPTNAITEMTLQAVSGLMSVHGRSSGKAGPLGMDYLTTFTAAMTMQAALAAAVGQLHGGTFDDVSVSPMGCALLSIGQYLAGATAPEDAELLLPGQTDPALRPPFVSEDNVVFELETLDGGPWRRFWETAGVSSDLAGRAWKAFLLRYAKAVSPIPIECVACLARLSFARIREIATNAGISVVPVRRFFQRQADADYQQASGIPWQFSAQPPTALRRLMATPTGLPLRGLRVVESCRRIQGPLAGHLLALLGAEVIRLEPPGGDPLRAMPPCFDGCSVRFDALNRLKTVREVDIKSEAGRSLIYELVRDSDVFLQNWAPGKAEELALDAERIHAVRPDLVYAYAGGWGRAVVNAPGTDFTVQAWSGVADTVARTTGIRGGTLFTALDVLGGVIATLGVTAGLLRRAIRGQGSKIETSLLGTADLLMKFKEDATVSDTLSGVFETADGLIAIDCRTSAQIRVLAAWLGLQTENVGSLAQKLTSRLSTRAAVVWESVLHSEGIPAGVVIENLVELQNDARNASYLNQQAYVSVNSPWSFQ